MNDQDQVDIGDDINERELRHRVDRLECEAAIEADEHVLSADEIDQLGDDETFGVRLQFPPTTDDDGPTAEALAGALFAQLGYVVSDIGEAETMAVIVDGDRETLALDLHKLDNALQQLGVIRDEIAQALAALMEGELEAIAGFAVKRTKSDKVEWDRESAWRFVRSAILDRWARDGVAYDSGKAELIDRTIHDIKTVYTSANPTVKGLQALAVNPYELRSTTPATRWTVKVTA